jgi:hypothetical protein
MLTLLFSVGLGSTLESSTFRFTPGSPIMFVLSATRAVFSGCAIKPAKSLNLRRRFFFVRKDMANVQRQLKSS